MLFWKSFLILGAREDKLSLLWNEHQGQYLVLLWQVTDEHNGVNELKQEGV